MSIKNKTFGAYIGAAIGDAMGGPVECSHYRRIRRLVGEIKGLLPYDKTKYSFHDPHPGYCLRSDAGAVTDDTFIRADFTRYFIDNKPPYTANHMVYWLLENADFSGWWPPVIEALEKVKHGEVKADEGGKSFFQGGGIGWWTPIGILHADNPHVAAEEVKKLSAIWKDELEQNFLEVVQGGLAEAMREGSSFDTVMQTMLDFSGPLPKKLINRAIEIAEKANDVYEMSEALYQTSLMPELELREEMEPTRKINGPMPENVKPEEDNDRIYLSSFYTEQVPFSIAGFVFGKGDPRISIPATVMIGRDCDSTATTVGSWVGAIHGERGLPKEWVDTVSKVNVNEIDIRGLAEGLFKRMKKNFQLIILLAGVILMTHDMDAQSNVKYSIPRGRPNIQGKTLVTDIGTPFRGGHLHIRKATDTNDFRMAQSTFDLLRKEFKLNAVRMHQDWSADDPNYLDYHLGQMDLCVDRAEKAGMYILIHGGHIGHQYDSLWYRMNKQFEVLAPRYGNRTHVIFEISNEPVNAKYGDYEESDIEGMKMVLATIRKYAPNTHVMLYSFHSILDGDYALRNLEKWPELDCEKQNVSISVHPYMIADKQKYKDALLKVAEKYPVVCSEWSLQYLIQKDKWDVGVDIACVHEELGISWFPFYPFQERKLELFRKLIDDIKEKGYGWKADWELQ